MDHTNFNDIPEMVDRETGNSNKAFDLLRGLEHDSAGHYASTTLEDFDADSGGDAGRGSFLERIKHRPAIAVVMLILLIALGFAAVRFWNYLQSYESTDDAQVDAHIDPISSRINGTITAVYVENNQRVKTGHLIVQLDPRDYEVAVEQARAQLAQAQANANSARQQYTSALAKIRQAQAEQFLARRNQERISTLARLGVVAQAQYDQYNASARVDEADVSAEQADALSAQRAIASRDAQVKAAQAGLDQALLNLGYTRIAAPADGIIGKRSAELDERIQPGESLMALTQMKDLWVTANFKETQLARMHAGQPVTIHVDALGRDFRGHVLSMPGATGSLYDLLPPENATGNYVKVVQRLPVRITFDGGQDLSHLRPGMSVEPTVWLQ